jgi:hypothetical protein
MGHDAQVGSAEGCGPGTVGVVTAVGDPKPGVAVLGMAVGVPGPGVGVREPTVGGTVGGGRGT